MTGMSVYGLLVDLSWELKIDRNVPLLGLLVANSPSAEAAAKRQVWEVWVEEKDSDAFRVLIGRTVAITADFREGGLRATPRDIIMEGKKEDLGQLMPQLPAGPPREEIAPSLCVLCADSVRARRYVLEDKSVRMTYESGDTTGPAYAERAIAAYDFKPWLRCEEPDFRELFEAEKCLVVFKYARHRPCLVGVLPVWK
jgi:hypothetical protein